jgi:hypothetical protein
MFPSFCTPPKLLRIPLLLGCAVALAACPSRSKTKAQSKAVPRAAEVIVPRELTQLSQPFDEVSKAVEKLTGEHTRIVWNEHQTRGESDPFSYENEQLLNGLDTRDGKGERTILAQKGNYSRPLISRDGGTILFTTRKLIRKDGNRDLSLKISRTDWAGSPPVTIADGFAADAWRDPKSGIEWIYCTRKFRGTRGNKFTARQLWRFQLDHPQVEELVFDDSRLAPEDNIQISGDGRRACGLFPWPHGGVIELDAKPPIARKLTNGCWPSMAPDSSGISWVFDGDHRSAHFFAEAGAHAWNVKFDAPCAAIGETYHPRWSNHARFMVLTGPYTSKKSGEMALHADGNQPDVYLGRFNETAKKMEAWVQVSKPGLAKAFPDVWVAHGEDARLKRIEAEPTAALASSDPPWPVRDQGLLLLWKDRASLNQWKDRTGRLRSVELEGAGAARFGRFGELVFDGGEYALEEEEDAVSRHTKASDYLSLESVVLGGTAPCRGWMFRCEAFGVFLDDSSLSIAAADGSTRRFESPEIGEPFHLVVNRGGGGFEVFVNGKPCALGASAPVPTFRTDRVILGSASLTRGMQRIAIYDSPLPRDVVSRHAAMQRSRLLTLPPAPARVRLKARMVESSRVPSLESIEPYTGALICSLYDVESVLEGEYMGKRILVKQWGLLNKHPVDGLPHDPGETYELVVEREADHPELRGERVSDDTEAFDLEAWFEVGRPAMP